MYTFLTENAWKTGNRGNVFALNHMYLFHFSCCLIYLSDDLLKWFRDFFEAFYNLSTSKSLTCCTEAARQIILSPSG